MSRSNDTLQVCHLKRLSRDQLQSLIPFADCLGFENVDSSKQGLLHHTTLQLCKGIESFPEPIRCGDFELTMECDLIFGLTFGTTVVMPSKIHFPLDPGVYIVEVHFDLSLATSGDSDTFDVSGSGIRTFYTLKEREKAASTLRMESRELRIPPQRKKYEVVGAVHSDFSRHFLPSEGVDILFIGPHMHYLGDSMRIDRITENGIVETLLEIKKWDRYRQLRGTSPIDLVYSAVSLTESPEYMLKNVTTNLRCFLGSHILFTTNGIQEIRCDIIAFTTVRAHPTGPTMA